MTTDSASRPILLGTYWAKHCPRRTHNEFDRTLPGRPEDFQFSDAIQGRIDAGRDFEGVVFAQLRALLGPLVVDVSGAGPEGPSAHVEATMLAMDKGALVIVGGRLPDDVAGGRSGKPDLLIRSADEGDWVNRFWPADIKNHKVIEGARKRELLFSVISEPQFERGVVDGDRQARCREDDLMQLAHYWRMLQACGREPSGDPRGAIVGADLVGEDQQHVFVWHDLDAETFPTFSRTAPSGSALRSALQRHDYEHALRIKIAGVARQRSGGHDDPDPVVVPVFIDECDSCPWVESCIGSLDDDEASSNVGRLSAREWLALRALGIGTVGELAVYEPEDVLRDPEEQSARTAELLEGYLPEVSRANQPLKRLHAAIMCARMVEDDTTLKKVTSDSIAVPRANIEIDLDVENDRAGLIYLWGLHVTDRDSGRSWYEDVSSWEPLDGLAESELGLLCWQRLRALVDQAQAEGRTALIYHYAHPEPNGLKRIAKDGLVAMMPAPADVKTFIDEYFVDLLVFMRTNFFGRKGLGLKVVAGAGPEFEWRDEDPGGLQSQVWLDEVYNGESQEVRRAARQRVLDYNEDDVRATLAVRSWLTELDALYRN